MASTPAKTDATYESIDAVMFFDFETLKAEGQESHEFEQALPALNEEHAPPAQVPDWTNDVHNQQPDESPFSPTPTLSTAGNAEDSFNASALFDGKQSEFAGFAGAWGAPRISELPQESPITAKPLLTAFVSPGMKPKTLSMSNSSHHKAPLSTEEKQLRQIEELRAQQAQERQQREDRMARALAGDGVDAMVRSAKPLTLPVTPKFATNKRMGRKEDNAVSFAAVVEEPSAKRTLRSGPTVAQPFAFATDNRFAESSNNAGAVMEMSPGVEQQSARRPLTAGLTIAKPFSFATDARYGEKEPVVVQEAPQQKQSTWTGKPTVPVTPQFATRARARTTAPAMEEAEEEPLQTTAHQWTGKPTVARTPQLSTKARARPQTVIMSTDQRQEEEMSRVPKFKARPLDRAILAGTGSMGVPLIPKMRLTRPEEFDFATAARAVNASVVHESFAAVEAEPVSVVVQEAPVARRKRTGPRPLTVPVTPKLSKSRRPSVRSKPRSAEKQIKQRPRPFTRSLTAPKPFNLATEVRGKEAKDLLRQKIDAEKSRDVKRRKFKAKPVQTHFRDQSARHHPEPRELTVPEPFALQAELRGAVSQEVFQDMVEELDAERKEAANFKARAYKQVPSERVFVPRRSNKPLTELDEFVLNSDVRAFQRREFEADMSEKRLMQSKMEAERERERQRREEREIREMRARMVPKARPIQHGNPIVIRPSSRPLTVPQSPAFATNKRFRRP